MVLWALENAWGGEIFVPKIPSFRIVDLATAIDPACRQEIVGVRPGEKIHEDLITGSDSFNTVDLGAYYAVLPTGGHYTTAEYCARTAARAVAPGFNYQSGTNPRFLGIEELRALVDDYEQKQRQD